MIKNITDNIVVSYHGQSVGTLALTPTGAIVFSYHPDWIAHGFSVSPFSLPLKPGVFAPKNSYFGGLFGVFADSLPDSWGSSLVAEYLRSKGLIPENLSLLTYLSLSSPRSLGGLEYGKGKKDLETSDDLDKICGDIDALSNKKAPSESLISVSGSSGGAHPKAHVSKDGGEWIVKFPKSDYPNDETQMEYDYNHVAASLGVEVADFKLFPSKRGPGYFASRRFDRKDGKRIHRISLAGLYEVSPDASVLDYGHLLMASYHLCHEEEELWKIYRLLCFNVTANNCDDHSKNFSFIYDEQRGHYVFGPAYDLTLTPYVKRHCLTVHGEFFPSEKDVLALAKEFSLDPRKAKSIYETIEAGVQAGLADYLKRIKRN